MKKVKTMLVSMIAMFFTFSVTVQAETLYLSIAASMTDAFKEIIDVFSENNSETRILLNFGSSGSLAKQIAQGAPADLYVSANPKWMKYLVKNEMIDLSTEKIFAFNKLVFVGRGALSVSRIKQIQSLQKIGIGTPQNVPAGQYAAQAMESAGIYSILVEERKLVFAKDVRQALLYADRGEIDGSFVYKTDALLARSAKILFTVPDTLYDRVSYPLALTVGGSAKPSAGSFYRFMMSEQVSNILKKYGFESAYGFR